MTTVTEERVSPAMQTLLDERRELMQHDLKFGLGKSGKARLQLIADEMAQLADDETDRDQDARLAYVGARQAYSDHLDETIAAFERFIELREQGIEMLARQKDTHRRAMSLGLQVEPQDTWAQRRVQGQPNECSRLWDRAMTATRGEW